MKKIKVIAKDGAYNQYVGNIYDVIQEEDKHYIVNHAMGNRIYSIGILKSHCEEVLFIPDVESIAWGTTPPKIKFEVATPSSFNGLKFRSMDGHDYFIGTDNGYKLDVGGNSKKIRRFPSGAVRSDDTGRPRPDWVSALAIEALGEHLAGNANDFGATNYLKGIPVDECLASLMRHYCEYKKTGNFVDLRSLAFNAVAALHTACLIKDGEYKEIYSKTELVDQEAYLKELSGNI